MDSTTIDAKSANIITLDVDWAPDFVIESVAAKLNGHGIPATWFVTHRSPAVDRLRGNVHFECGIHPNFNAGSTHGDSAEQVLKHCMRLVPEARSVRTHTLVQSSRLFELFCELTPVEFDSTTLLYGSKHVSPGLHLGKTRNLLKLPFVWEDDVYMRENHGDPSWRKRPSTVELGPTIYNFHPIHIYLNSRNLTAYELAKSRHPDLRNAKPSDLDDLINRETGTGTLFDDLLRSLERSVSCTIAKCGDCWMGSRPPQ